MVPKLGIDSDLSLSMVGEHSTGSEDAPKGRAASFNRGGVERLERVEKTLPA